MNCDKDVYCITEEQREIEDPLCDRFVWNLGCLASNPYTFTILHGILFLGKRFL